MMRKYLFFCLIGMMHASLTASAGKATAREVVGHVFNLLLDGYLIITSRTDKSVKAAAIADAVKHAEEIFSYMSTSRACGDIHSEEGYSHIIKTLLCNPGFIELLHKSAEERMKEMPNSLSYVE